MDEWHVGDPADWGDSVGVPDIDYMGYLQDDDEDDDTPRHVSRQESLMDEAWRLREEYRPEEALRVINKAMKYRRNWRSYNIKAIILEDMYDYEAALANYDMALNDSAKQFIKDNKARLLEKMAKKAKLGFDYEKSLSQINLALKITANDDDRCSFFATKRDTLEAMGMYREAYVCNKLANRQPELVDVFEKQYRILKNSKDTLICIAARSFFDYTAPCSRGSVVELLKEPDHPYDPDAIIVKFKGKIVGYVANGHGTLIDEVSSASDIKDLFENTAKAEVMFLFMERHLIAKLI
jgi:tetratricopeptide (TPR) repeat protein